MMERIFGLALRAVKALETLADNSQKVVALQEKSIKICKGMINVSESFMALAPEDVKEDPSYPIFVQMMAEVKEALE